MSLFPESPTSLALDDSCNRLIVRPKFADSNAWDRLSFGPRGPALVGEGHLSSVQSIVSGKGERERHVDTQYRYIWQKPYEIIPFRQARRQQQRHCFDFQGPPPPFLPSIFFFFPPRGGA